MLRAFEQGGIFIVPHLLRRGTSVYTVSSERPVNSVELFQNLKNSFQNVFKIHFKMFKICFKKTKSINLAIDQFKEQTNHISSIFKKTIVISLEIMKMKIFALTLIKSSAK
jgi:hypothetical protein